MKTKLFSLLIFLFVAVNINAQSFYLEWDGEVLGDTVNIFPDSTNAEEIMFDAMVHNNTPGGVNIRVAKNEILMMEGSNSYFCVDTCYPTSVDTSTALMFIPAGGYSVPGYFSGHYEINGAIGISIVEYTYFNVDIPEENVKIVVKYENTPANIYENIFSKILISDIYPNPTTNFVNIDFELPNEVTMANVRIVNLLGSIILEQQVNLTNNAIRVDVSGLNGGIYFYSFIVNNKAVSTKKLIIR